MSLAMIIFSMIAAWLAIACAMLWGVLRVSRRHQTPVASHARGRDLSPCAVQNARLQPLEA